MEGGKTTEERPVLLSELPTQLHWKGQQQAVGTLLCKVWFIDLARFGKGKPLLHSGWANWVAGGWQVEYSL